VAGQSGRAPRPSPGGCRSCRWPPAGSAMGVDPVAAQAAQRGLEAALGHGHHAAGGAAAVEHRAARPQQAGAQVGRAPVEGDQGGRAVMRQCSARTLPASMEAPMIFRQLFDPVSSTYTYLLADRQRPGAADRPRVRAGAARPGAAARTGPALLATLDTHVHADHVTGAWLLQQRSGSRILVAAPAVRRAPTGCWRTATASPSAAAISRCAPRRATPTAA
jgi:hypothetical protein